MHSKDYLGGKEPESSTPWHYSSPDREAPAYTTWKQRDGTPIQLRHMDDKHIFHTIKMLERIAERKAKRASRASYLEEEHAFVPLASDLLPPIYKKLVAMAEARGIDWEAKYTPPLTEEEACFDKF